MSTQRIISFTLVPLTALALVAALVFLTSGPSTLVQAADTPNWQQMRGTMPMTGTMAMDNAMPAMMSQMMQQMQTMMGQNMGMMGARPITSTMPMTGAMSTHQQGQGAHMVMMGRMMQMMGMMMEMMGHMQAPMATGMVMTDTLSMQQGMSPDMMQMMQQMMQQMQTMMGQNSIRGTTLVTNTAAVSNTTAIALPNLPQTAQVGAVAIEVTPANLEDTKAPTLDFKVALNSHSQEIEADLAKTASLRSGAVTVTPSAWETTSPKGHHVIGVLRFARIARNGEPLLANATALTLVLSGLPGDVERTFTWTVRR